MNFKSNIKSFLFLAVLIQTLSSCEDVVEIETDPLTPQLVVDAWINNLYEPQTIFLSMTQPYFDNRLPEGLSGATVQVVRQDGVTFDFIEAEKGNYVWMPGLDENLGEVDSEFGLLIELDGKTYGSLSVMNRVPAVDSISHVFEESSLGEPEGIYAEFFARDIVGEGDTYWIKTYKNGEFLNKPFEINIAFDAGFSAGGAIDGLIFVPPIREAVNRVSDTDGDDDGDVAPWAIDDEIRVEIHSISNEAFYFLSTAQTQMTNGFNGIFAQPVINTSGNIVEIDGEEEVLGVFNVAAISSLTKVID